MPQARLALHAYKWSLLGEVASKLIAPLVFLILARLLVPEDFGVVAAATIVISFSQVFADAGLMKALIQRQDSTGESANVVFWLNLALGLVVVAILLAVAPLVGRFFHDPRVTPVVRVLSLQVLLAAFSSVNTALLQKELDFKQLFWVRLSTTGLPALVAIPLALQGMGYWALVASSLFGQAAQSAMLWRRSSWRPRWGLDRQLAVELLAFGKWAMLSGLLAWFYGWMDAIVVGHYLGPHDMGLYRTGNTFVTMAIGLLFAPLLPVLYSLFSRIGHDRDAVAVALMDSAALCALFSLPTAALIAICSGVIESHVFGSQWSGLAPIIALLAASQGLAWLVGGNGEAYRAIGRPQLESWAMGLSTIAYFVGYMISIPYGLLAFAATRAGLVFAGLLLQILISERAFGLHLLDWIKVLYKPATFSLLAFLIARSAELPALGSVGNAFLQSVIMILVYASLLLVFDKKQVSVVRNYLHAA